MSSSTPQYYSQEQIQQILNLAITRQAYEGEFTREQLLEIATELEISPECLQIAEQDWVNQQRENLKQQTFRTYRVGKLKHKAGKFAIVNSSLVSLNFLTAGHLSWSIYILLFWGAGMALDAWKTYNIQSDEYQRAYYKWERNNQVKQTFTTFLRRLQQAWEA